MAHAFQPWKAIGLGTHDQQSLLRALVAGYEINQWDRVTVAKIPLAPKPWQVSLTRVTVRELGFPDGTSRRKVYTRARHRGLELCPAEVGPQLRLQHPDQPEGECLHIAMKPIKDDERIPGVFVVENVDGHLLLDTEPGYLEDELDPDCICVFVSQPPGKE